MKKLVALMLLCVPLLCNGAIMKGSKSGKRGGGKNHSHSKLTRAVTTARKARFSRYTRELHRVVIAAAQNTAVLAGHKKERVYYGKPYVSALRSNLEEIKNPSLRKIEEAGHDTFGVVVNAHSGRAAAIGSRYLPFYLFNARDGQKLFGPAFLIKDKEGTIATAVPTRVPILITRPGGEVPPNLLLWEVVAGERLMPFTYITISMRSPERLPKDATVFEALNAEERNTLAFHSIEEGRINNIKDYAFTEQDVASYALDPQSTLFSTKIEDGKKIYIPKQRMLLKGNGSSDPLFMLSPQDKLVYDEENGGLWFKDGKYRPAGYAKFQKAVLKDALWTRSR